MGWSLSEFDALPERERDDWLAFSHHRREQLASMMRQLRAMIDDNKSVDGGAYMAVWLAMLEA